MPMYEDPNDMSAVCPGPGGVGGGGEAEAEGEREKPR